METATGICGLGQRRGGRVHAFLIDDGHGRTLIDTLADDDARRVLAAWRHLSRSPADLTRIVLTHGHRSTWAALAAGWPAFNLNPTQERASLRRMAGLDVAAIGVGHGEPIVRDAAETLGRVVGMA